MTLKRFTAIYNSVFADYVPPTGPDVLVMPGCSDHTIDALIAASHGDFSHFDRASEIRERSRSS